MKFEKEYISERIKFFDGLAKYAFAALLLFSSGIGGLLVSKEKLSELYFQNLFIVGLLVDFIFTILVFYLLNKQ
jgi:hypothetical protein